MLSYRHAFHAGNHADVLKHLVQVLILEYLVRKEGKPLRYIDTHAGRGNYDLRSAAAKQNCEYETGIGRLWQRQDLPDALALYVDLVASVNAPGVLARYPGSPAIAARLLQASHRLQLFELHPDDAGRLQRWAAQDRRVQMQSADGLAALKAILPPPEKRALVMIDPSYEVKSDYVGVVTALKAATKKFATGVYALWYPLLARLEMTTMLKQLEALPVRSLLVELPVCAAADTGMVGSGVFVINPPWLLEQQLRDSLPYLQDALAGPDARPWRLQCNGD